MLSKLLGGEDRSTVRHVLERDDAQIAAHKFKGFESTESLMGVEVDLVLDVDESGGVVNKDAPSSVHVGGISTASRVELDALGGAYKMVYRNPLAREQFVFLEDRRGLVGHRVPGAAMSFGWPGGLFAKLTGSTFGASVTAEFGGSEVECSTGGRQAQDSSTHEELDLGVVEVSETLMPAKKFLGGFIQIEIVGVDCLGHDVEGIGGLLDFRHPVCSGDWDVVLWTYKGLDGCAFRVMWDPRQSATLFCQLNGFTGVLLEKTGSSEEFDRAGGDIVPR